VNVNSYSGFGDPAGGVGRAIGRGILVEGGLGEDSDGGIWERRGVLWKSRCSGRWDWSKGCRRRGRGFGVWVRLRKAERRMVGFGGILDVSGVLYICCNQKIVEAR
jgi:hypothetical protein